ncbi:MAG TPA: hypothetical protein DD670_10755 [Planctomycetaceae bacterium]|nr:hypothetical protein [Planctomycetaceae bacterium]
MTIRAFVGYGRTKLAPEQCDVIARGIHEAFRRNKTETPADPSMADWEELNERLKNSNRDQANHVFEKLREIGCVVTPLVSGEAEPFTFTPAEVERLAEMEHGRWNAERLLDGWRLGFPKDIIRKISPYIVPWADLSEDVREWDRKAMLEIPTLLAQVGMQVVRNK